MGSVNPAIPTTLPARGAAQPPLDGTAGWSFGDGLTAMAGSVGSTMTDAATFVGVDSNEDGSLKAGVDLPSLGGFAAITAGPTALMALGNRVDPLTGVSTRYADRLGSTAAANSMRVTPTLVSALLGPAIADGITMVAPNLVKKYKDTKDIRDAAEKKQTAKENQNAKISRAVAGGVAVGLAAGAVFLLKPDLFRKFGVGVTHAIEGSTSFAVNGKVTKLSGVLDAGQIGSALTAIGKPLQASDKLQMLKTVAPMAKDAVFSNRAVIGTAGGIGTMLLANAAAGETDPDKQKLMWGLTAGAGALTLGGAYGIGKLTQGSIKANGGAGGLLAKNQLLFKPNIEWIKKYATTIAPITAVPAGTAASQYFNIVDDFENITAPRSPFRK